MCSFNFTGDRISGTSSTGRVRVSDLDFPYASSRSLSVPSFIDTLVFHQSLSNPEPKSNMRARTEIRIEARLISDFVDIICENVLIS